MAISSRQVQNKRDGNGVLTGRPGTVYDVNIKYKAPDGTRKSYAKKEAAQHEAEMKTKLQNPGQIASVGCLMRDIQRKPVKRSLRPQKN